VVEQNPERLRLPDQVIQLPFPSDISPIADSVIEHTTFWAQATGLVPGAQAAERLRRNGIMHAGPRLVPDAPPAAAFLVCDWTVFLIVIDDEFDDGRELGARPDLAQAAIEDVVGSFRRRNRGLPYRFPELSGIGVAVADLGRRFEAMSPSREWLPRFMRHAEEHLWSKVLEAQQRASGTVLGVSSYVDLRRITSAAYTYAGIVELTEQVVIPAPVRESPAWELMLDAFADAWLGIQDICSCAKEVAAGDELNLAAVMALGSGAGLQAIQQGVDDAYHWVSRRSAEFMEHRARLAEVPGQLGLDGAAASDIARYLDALSRLLGGHLTWNSKDNPRYSQVISIT
jgi:terpene synthase-like protein